MRFPTRPLALALALVPALAGCRPPGGGGGGGGAAAATATGPSAATATGDPILVFSRANGEIGAIDVASGALVPLPGLDTQGAIYAVADATPDGRLIALNAPVNYH